MTKILATLGASMPPILRGLYGNPIHIETLGGFLTWHYGLPSSSSHALIGGLIGAVMVKHGTSPLMWDGITRTMVFIIASPCLGFILGAGINTIMRNALPNASARQGRFFRYAQIASAAFYSLGHGTNDAQKTAGIIWLILIAAGWSMASSPIPQWAVWMSFAAMGLGTLAGGWRIVHTLGFKLTHLDQRGGFTAETSIVNIRQGNEERQR